MLALRTLYDLWRNDELLGSIVVQVPEPDPDLIGGLLIPSALFSDVGPMMQHKHSLVPGEPVLVHRLSTASKRRRAALTPLTPEQAAGAPIENRLYVRDTNGVTVSTDSITIDVMDVPEGSGEFATACLELGIAGQAWFLIAHRTKIAPTST